eukprot:m.203115 g.203115  ORF g.203115 m.203115 type:complete len:196 (+) comp14987_c1_seq1:80-667(+)
MDAFTPEQLRYLQEMDGFNESFMDTYFALEPDGEYVEDQYLVTEAAGAEEAPQDQYLAVSDDWLTSQHQLLSSQPWFRSSPYGRQSADSELAGKPVGSFVVRVSSQQGNYAVSVVRDSGKVDHMLVLPSWAGSDSTAPGQTQYRIGTYSTNLFNTIPKLVAYYIAHPFYNNERLLGFVMPESQDGGLYLDVRAEP